MAMLTSILGSLLIGVILGINGIVFPSPLFLLIDIPAVLLWVIICFRVFK